VIRSRFDALVAKMEREGVTAMAGKGGRTVLLSRSFLLVLGGQGTETSALQVMMMGRQREHYPPLASLCGCRIPVWKHHSTDVVCDVSHKESSPVSWLCALQVLYLDSTTVDPYSPDAGDTKGNVFSDLFGNSVELSGEVGRAGTKPRVWWWRMQIVGICHLSPRLSRPFLGHFLDVVLCTQSVTRHAYVS
jgi:hypothetical protein